LNPLTAVLPDLFFPSGTQKGDAEAAAIKQAERDKAQRKGDLMRNNDKQETEPAPLLPGVRYILDFTVTTEWFGEAQPASPHQVPFFLGDDIAITHDGNTVYIGGRPNTNTRGTAFVITSATANGIRREDGVPLPPPVDVPSDPGAPLVVDPGPPNQEAPTLPPARSQNPQPTKQQSLPSTGAPTPNEGQRTPDNPSKPATPEPTKPGGENTPQTPQPPLSPANPSNPGQGINAESRRLDNIPGAPSTGSATEITPAYPSSFTEVPGQRTEEPYRRIEEPPEEPQRKPGCADPCIATIQNALPPLASSLDGLDALLGQLLAGQQQQQQEQEEQQQEEQERNELITINVPVCSCNEDGTASIQDVAIQVLASQEALTIQQFSTLATLQTAQCKIQRHTERSHNILGGDVWFDAAASRNPAFNTRIERKVKEAGTLFGFPAIAAETGTPSTVGQMTAHNIIELINGYTANLYHRAGFQGLPTTVPKTLLGYTDDEEPETINDLSTYFVWFVKQVDALIGKFPVNITIEDVDPLTQGNQTKEIELPNIAEALAEMYGVNLSTSVNADVTVNFLMRLASELIATKNSTLITQDYVRANAAFLGYKGNPARREVDYSFNPAKLDSLDEFLKESKGYLVGWEEDDKESVVGFLQRIVFSAGLIKSVFFRDKKRLAEFQKEVESMMKGDKVASEAEWNALLALLNDPTEYFNKDSIPHPRVRDKPASSTGGTTA
jgi:hypothetical protein